MSRPMLCLLLILGCCVPAFATEPDAPAAEPVRFELRQVVQQAVATHPAVGGQALEVRVAEDEVRARRAGWLPSVDVRLSAGYEKSHNEVTRSRALSGDYSDSYKSLWRNDQSLTVSQLLYDGSATSAQTRAARQQVAAAEETLYSVAEQTGLRAVEAYLDVLRYRRILQLAEENVAAHQELLAKVRVRAESGGGPRSDVEQALSRLADAEAQRLEIEGGLRDAATRYQEVVGAAPGELAMPEKPADLMPASDGEALAQAVADNRQLKAAAARVQKRQAEWQTAKAAYLPRLDLELSASRQENLDGLQSNGYDVMGLVVLRYNLFNGGADAARVSQANHLLRQATVQQAELRRRVEEEVRITFNALTTSGRRLPVLAENVAKTRQVLMGYRDQFTLGKRSLLDLLDTQSELFGARIKLLNGEVSHTFAHYRMLAPSSRLLTALDVTVAE